MEPVLFQWISFTSQDDFTEKLQDSNSWTPAQKRVIRKIRAEDQRLKAVRRNRAQTIAEINDLRVTLKNSLI